MTNKIFMDVRTNAFVRVVKEINSTTVMVLRLKDKTRYITDKKDLKGIKSL